MKTPSVVKHLIIVNIIMFAATWIDRQTMFDWFAMHFPENPLFRPWQILTHMFMHGNTMHILFNMYAIWAFGTPLVYHYGEKKFLWFFLLSGLGAVAFYTGIQYIEYYRYLAELEKLGVSRQWVETVLHHPGFPDISRNFYALENFLREGLAAQGIPLTRPVWEAFLKLLGIYNVVMLGASGAVYGILVAFAFFYPRAKLMFIFIPYPIEARYFIPLLILSDIFLGITNVFHTPIAHFAHVGGALTGLLLLWLWRKKRNEYYF